MTKSDPKKSGGQPSGGKTTEPPVTPVGEPEAKGVRLPGSWADKIGPALIVAAALALFGFLWHINSKVTEATTVGDLKVALAEVATKVDSNQQRLERLIDALPRTVVAESKELLYREVDKVVIAAKPYQLEHRGQVEWYGDIHVIDVGDGTKDVFRVPLSGPDDPGAELLAGGMVVNTSQNYATLEEVKEWNMALDEPSDVVEIDLEPILDKAYVIYFNPDQGAWWDGQDLLKAEGIKISRSMEAPGWPTVSAGMLDALVENQGQLEPVPELDETKVPDGGQDDRPQG